CARLASQILLNYLQSKPLSVLRHEKHPKGWIGVQLLGCSSMPGFLFAAAGGSAGGTCFVREPAAVLAFRPDGWRRHAATHVCMSPRRPAAPKKKKAPEGAFKMLRLVRQAD
ncbi:hypothetical protein KGP75_15345, partial [Burkholderia cenocepacia]|nr:hypothetical protein [Burkholderia cenocepacia]MCO8378943.1 hypothetical protein [Burkholderia cenocepacia]MCO8393143.1 hypothetical protein [Burkholderia cenocepacia]MCO8399977.1 hypothetical protein [Burkholderia cenocepacia]MCO8413653.1 hypothetical protein [Burkholderia cenocepacia]